MDPEDIRLAKGESEREKQRRRLINSFLYWGLGKQAKKEWSGTNNEDRIIIKRQYAYLKALTCFGCFANFAIYNCFFTGIYNLRTTELVNMKRVPVSLKLGLSWFIAFGMCYKLWQDNIYDAQLYKVALNYRNSYDKKHAFVPVRGEGGDEEQSRGGTMNLNKL